MTGRCLARGIQAVCAGCFWNFGVGQVNRYRLIGV